MFDWTIAEVRHDGAFPVAFTLFYDVEHPDDCTPENLRARFHGVAAPGFMALTRDDAERLAPLVSETMPIGRVSRAMPIQAAQERYAEYRSQH